MTKEYKPFKKNKTNICRSDHLKGIKEMYFNKKSIKDIAEKYGYTTYTISKYINGNATAMRGDEKRCSKCLCVKPLSEFYKYKIYYNSHCRYCEKIIKQNRITILKNRGKFEEYKVKRRKSIEKNKDKYNMARRIENLSEEKQEQKRQRWNDYYKRNKEKLNKKRRVAELSEEKKIERQKKFKDYRNNVRKPKLKLLNNF